MTIRPEVIELLTSFDPDRSLWPTHLVHADGRPYMLAENALVASATDEETEVARSFVSAGTEHTRRWSDDLYALVRASQDASIPDSDRRAFLSEAAVPGGDVDKLTISELQDRGDAEANAVVTVFRARILPRLVGWARGEALDRLDRLDPAGTADGDQEDLREYRASKLADLRRLKEIIASYSESASQPMADYWHSIPPAEQDEARDILRRLGWLKPGEQPDRPGTEQ